MFYAPLPRTLAAALRDVSDPKAPVRVSAVKDLARHGEAAREAVIEGLEKALSDSNGLVRASAAEGLGELGAKEVLRSLLVCLEDEQQLVRQKAIAALGEIGDSRAQQRLERALGDERPEVRFQAVMAYPRVTGDRKAALAALVRATKDSDEIVAHIAFRMGEELSESGSVDPALVKRAKASLKHESTRLRCVAAVVLGHAGDPAGDKTLISIANGKLDSPEGEDVAAALELVGTRKLAAGEAGLLERAFSGIAGFRRDPFAFHALIALCVLGNERAKQAVQKDLESFSVATRTLAVSAIGRAKLQEARPKLLALKDRKDRVDPAILQTALELLDAEST